ncbi:MAG TPA: hypothetical protein VI136_15095 [Verrucomicrobiae bacterium]
MASTDKKNLILAWVLNVLPGIGLIYVGKTSLGVLFMIIGAVLLLLCMTGIGAIIGLPLYLLTSLIACISSVVAASKHNKSL